MSNREVVVGGCDTDSSNDLTDCDITTVDECMTDELAWLECTSTGIPISYHTAI